MAARRYDTGSDEGLRLIAHEVAHTAQQAGASPTRQDKLEVSTSSDRAEVEADVAADAMVAGRAAMVTPYAALSRKILRDEDDEDMPELKSLNQHIAEDNRPNDVDQHSQYGFGDVHGRDGEPNMDDPVVANAKKQGALSELQRLSEEMTIAKPLFMSWIESAAAATTIASACSLSISTPEAYKKDVEKLGRLMASGSQKGKELRNLAAAGNTTSALSVKTAGLGITEAIAKVTSARNKLASYQAQLQQATKKKELQEKQDELAKVQAEIKLVANLLKQTAALATDLTKASSLVSAMTTTAKAYDKGYNEISGTTDTTEEILQWAFYQTKIDGINKGIASLGKDIQGLSVKIQAFNTAEFQSELAGAKASFEKSKLAMQNQKESYFNKMQVIGRAYDEKDLKPDQRALFDGATPAAGEKHSMEGILSLSAALQSRGVSRKAFASLVANSPNLQRAPEIVDKALGGGVGVPVRDDFGNEEFVWLPQDHPYMNPSADLVAKAKQLRDTCGNFTAAIKHLKEQEKTDTDIEARWQNMVESGTSFGGGKLR